MNETAAGIPPPFRLARRLAALQKPGAGLPLAPPFTLRYAKRLKPRPGGEAASHRHAHLSVHIVQRLSQRFAQHLGATVLAWRDAPGSSPVPPAPVAWPRGPAAGGRLAVEPAGPAAAPPVAAGPLPAWPLPPPPRPLPGVQAVGGGAGTAGRLLRPADAALPPAAAAFPPPPLPWRGGLARPEERPPTRRLGRLQPALGALPGEAPAPLSWPGRREAAKEAAAPPLRERPAGPLRPLARRASARLAADQAARAAAAGGAAQAAGPASRLDFPAPARAAAAPFTLSWREAQAGRGMAQAGAPRAEAGRREPAAGGAGAPAAAPGAEERLAAKAREAVRLELSSQATLERLAGDLMRRLDNRLRIERERRGL